MHASHTRLDVYSCVHVLLFAYIYIYIYIYYTYIHMHTPWQPEDQRQELIVVRRQLHRQLDLHCRREHIKGPILLPGDSYVVPFWL